MCSMLTRQMRGLARPSLEGAMGQAITHFPNGDRTAGVVVVCLVDLSGLMGQNMTPGDGPIPWNEQGERERSSGYLEVPVETVVNERSVWLIDGWDWTTVRRVQNDVGANAAYTAWLITRVDPHRTQNSQTKKDRPVPKA